MNKTTLKLIDIQQIYKDLLTNCLFSHFPFKSDPLIQRKDVKVIQKGDKRVIRGWVMYDWANSVFQLTIASAIFPVYYASITKQGGSDVVDFFGLY